MPEKATIARARSAKRQGKAPSTQAGEFVREEIHHVREGKHGARSTKQAIAIGLSKARRAGVRLPVPKRAKASTKRSARSANAAAKRHKPSVPAQVASLFAQAQAREPSGSFAKGALTPGQACRPVHDSRGAGSRQPRPCRDDDACERGAAPPPDADFVQGTNGIAAFRLDRRLSLNGSLRRNSSRNPSRPCATSTRPIVVDRIWTRSPTP